MRSVWHALSAAGNDQHKPATGDAKGGDSETPPLEWAIACLGLVLVVTALGLLLYKAIRREESPPQITVRVMSIVPG